MADLHQSIYSTHDTVKSIDGDNKENIIAFDENKNEVTINWTLVDNWSDENDWKLNRQSEYPSHDDCIHALLDGGDTLTDLQAKRTATKTKYPKPE